VCVPAQISGQTYNISGVEFQFTCNFAQTVKNIELTEKACSSNDQCESTQCCAVRESELRTVTATATTASPNNTPARRYCIDKTKAGSQFWMRYSAGATPHNLNNDIAVSAECMEKTNFKKLETLKVATTQTVENNIVIDNQKGTIITTFLQKVGSYLKLTDETSKVKEFVPLQLHFHAPSEHTFNGKHYDLELHIVNANSDVSQLSVLGIFFDVEDGGSESNWFIS
jgi:carbonic anhydrase